MALKAPVRVAVIGVGEMGANHARVYRQLKDADLIAVVDSDFEKAKAVAERYECAALPSGEELTDLVDAASVAVPSALHASVAIPFLEQGISCLIEKPLATSRPDANRLVEAAEASNAQLLVGHIERFNPAVDQLRTILNNPSSPVDSSILAIEARRMSAVSGRVADVNVVVDLMVHDIDIVLELVGEAPDDITVRGVQRGTSGVDYAVAVIHFPGGTLATLMASRITQNQIRSLHVTTADRLFTVDYPDQKLDIFQQGRLAGLAGAQAGAEGQYVLDVNTERVFVRRTEPLVNELEHFVAVARGDQIPKVGGRQALAALEVVWEIQSLVGNL